MYIDHPGTGPQNSGRYWQMVITQRSFISLKSNRIAPLNSGRYRQVVTISRLSFSTVFVKCGNSLHFWHFGTNHFQQLVEKFQFRWRSKFLIVVPRVKFVWKGVIRPRPHERKKKCFFRKLRYFLRKHEIF